MRLCACGCGGVVNTAGKRFQRIYFNKSSCRNRHARQQIKTGEILPAYWKNCARKECGKPFPIYKNYTKDTQRYCGASCSSKDNGHKPRKKRGTYDKHIIPANVSCAGGGTLKEMTECKCPMCGDTHHKSLFYVGRKMPAPFNCDGCAAQGRPKNLSTTSDHVASKALSKCYTSLVRETRDKPLFGEETL